LRFIGARQVRLASVEGNTVGDFDVVIGACGQTTVAGAETQGVMKWYFYKVCVVLKHTQFKKCSNTHTHTFQNSE
jgi:hypothetical protein